MRDLYVPSQIDMRALCWTYMAIRKVQIKIAAFHPNSAAFLLNSAAFPLKMLVFDILKYKNERPLSTFTNRYENTVLNIYGHQKGQN